MSQQSIKFIRKVTRVGGRSLSIVIPAEIARALSIRERQKLTLELDGDSIIIRDWNPTLNSSQDD